MAIGSLLKSKSMHTSGGHRTTTSKSLVDKRYHVDYGSLSSRLALIKAREAARQAAAKKKISGSSALSKMAKEYVNANKVYSGIKNGTNTAQSYSTSAGRVSAASGSIPSSINSSKAVKKASSVDGYLDENISGTMYEDIANKNNALSVMMNRENNAFNAQQAAMQRSYEENLANTAHQREVADLKAAGLNPILSAGGQGAVTPVGSNASSNQFSGVDSTIVPALANLAATSIGANATMTAASTQAAAAQAAAAMQSNAMMYGSDMNYRAAQYTSNNALQASKYTANTGAAAQKYSARMNAGANVIGSALGLAKAFI